MADTRAPKRKDYERIALDAAKASIAAQTAAHVAVLEAADGVAAADTALAHTQAHRDRAAHAHAEAAAAFAQLVGAGEAAIRLDLSPAQLRALTKTTRTASPAPAPTGDGAPVGRAGGDQDPADSVAAEQSAA